MLVSLPLAGFVLLFSVFREEDHGWRSALILAATTWGVLVVLITEVLSLQPWLTKVNLAMAWLLADIAILSYLRRVTRRKAASATTLELRRQLHQRVIKLGYVNIGLLVGAAVIIVLIGVIALASPPNTWDAMVYHMPRVSHWMQNRSVAFYPTHVPRQLHMPPWAEFAMLHLHMLFGGDRLNNLVQWFSLFGSVVAVSLLAQALGAGYRGQALAAVICATIPQGILQASAAKNDYVVAFWLAALAYCVLSFKREPTWTHAFGIGGALGLAWLTKGTGYIFSSALLLAWAPAWPWKTPQRLRRLALAAVLGIGLTAGHSLRNYGLYGSPLGPGAEGPAGAYKYTNDAFTASTLISNVMRNLALHMGTRHRAVNTALERWVEGVIHAFGGDVNDPRTTWDFATFHIPKVSKHESLAGNPIHLILIVLTLVMLIGWGRMRKSGEVCCYVLGLVLAFVLFCALLKWQLWHSRLHLPLFVLWSAASGVILARAWPSSVTLGLALWLLLLSRPAVLENQLRPLVGEMNIFNLERMALYFADRQHVMPSFLAATALVRGVPCQDVGLDFHDFEFYEYPLLVLLDTENGSKHVRHVGVENPSTIYAEGAESGFKPCAVICLNCVTSREKWEKYTSPSGSADVFQDIVVFQTQRTSQSGETWSRGDRL